MVPSWLQYLIPSQYVCQEYHDSLRSGSILISYFNKGSMLSKNWNRYRHDKKRCFNLFQDMARTILSLNKSSLPRIGSLALADQGVINLTDRPLTTQLQALESEGIPSAIGCSSTYSAVDTYLLYLVDYYNSCIRHQPNSIPDQDAGHQQPTELTTMNVVLSQFISRENRHGPSVFTLRPASEAIVSSRMNGISLASSTYNGRTRYPSKCNLPHIGYLGDSRLF